MKNKILQLLAITVIASAFTSCDDAKYDEIKNAVYISEAENGNIRKITIDEQGGSTSLTVRSAAVLENDVNVTVGLASKEELNNFNKRNGTNYTILPNNSYSLSKSELTIEKGKVSATSIIVKIKPLTEDMINSGNKFVLLLTIKSENEKLLENAKTIFYVLDQVIVTSAPILTPGSKIDVEMPNANIKTLAWTLEYRINAEKLYSTNTAQGVSWWGAGPALEIYFRWGDANVPGNLLMIKTQGGQFVTKTPAKQQKWYHYAWVHDGKTVKCYINGEFDSQMDSPGKMSEMENQMSISGGKFGYYMFSEWRFWSVARTQKQIKENMFIVNPKSTGLELYMRMNEGSGRDIKDYAGKYNVTAKINEDVEWKHGIRSDE